MTICALRIIKNIRLPKLQNLHFCRNYSQSTEISNETITKDCDDWKEELYATMNIYNNFISPEEETSLINEVEPYLKRLRYEESHWDDVNIDKQIRIAIHGYRETERLKWSEENTKIINKIRAKAFPPDKPQLSLVHVLDLSAEGWIKPHVDSVKFCGDVIAGISLLSDSVMRLTMVGHEKERLADFYLPRRSLYIMSGAARYKYNHAILSDKESFFEQKKVPRGRRISIICRCEPNSENID